MKRLLCFASGIILLCACSREEVQETPEVLPPAGWGYDLPYYFVNYYYMYLLHFYHEGGDPARKYSPSGEINRIDYVDREVIWSFSISGAPYRLSQFVSIPDEEYAAIRKAIGDTVAYYHSDAYPGDEAFLHDFTKATLKSDAEYEGIAAGESLNDIVDITYITCMPWIRANYCDENGKKCDVHYSIIRSSLSALNLADLDGCAGTGKLIFPVAPAPGQQFVLVFSGGKADFSQSFSF